MTILDLFARCCDLLRAGDPAAMTLLPQLETHPDFAPGWQDLAAVLEGAGHAAAARVAWQRAAAAWATQEAARPSERGPPFALGQCLRRVGRQHEAAAALERAVAHDPAFAQGWFALGLARQDAGQTEAAAAFAEALRCRPGWHEAALNLGVARQEAGELEAALPAYGIALRARPESLGRIAQALASGRRGLLALRLDDLRARLLAAAG